MTPSIQELLAVRTGAVKGVIVTLKANENEGYDFYSRYFAPWVGIPEDPVTGSAHTVLAAYWQKEYNKNQFRGMLNKFCHIVRPKLTCLHIEKKNSQAMFEKRW